MVLSGQALNKKYHYYDFEQAKWQKLKVDVTHLGRQEDRVFS
jgi:hypothetical protein